VSVTELILNAVALGIILDIDDLLFDALATTPGRHLVHQLDPLPMPSMPRIRGADIKSMSMSVMIPAALLLVYYSMLGPFVGTLTDVKLAMCGGNQNFVWTMDKRRITHLSPTFGGGWEEEEESVKADAINEGENIGFGMSIDEALFGVWVSDVSVLTDLDASDLDDLIEEGNEDCEDMITQVPMLNHLRFLLSNESIQSCADVVPYCNSLTKMPEFAVDGGKGWSARMLCSETCGCSNPGGEFINVQGCPYLDGECRNVPAFQAHQSSAVCIEKTPSALRDFVPWRQWVKAIRNYGMEETDLLGGQEEALILAQAMEDNGCGFLDNLTAQNLSLGGCFSWSNDFDWEFKTLEIFCPLTCGCTKLTSDETGCPKPFGRDCDELKFCLTVGEQHVCPGLNAEIIYALILYTAASNAALIANGDAVSLAMQAAIAQSANLTEPLDLGFISVEFHQEGAVWVKFHVLNDMDLDAIKSAVYANPLANFQAALDASLTSSQASLSDLGLTVTWAGDPAGPYGGYGYGYSGPPVRHLEETPAVQTDTVTSAPRAPERPARRSGKGGKRSRALADESPR